MSELKPCPFCGGMPKVNDWTLKGITDKRCFCDNEKCPVYLSKTIAIDDWNTRPIEDALTARIAELEAARRWIPFDWECKENQPDHMQVCLVLTTDNEMYSAMFLSDNCWTGLCRDFCKYEVAYWMQLPEPPEVKE